MAATVRVVTDPGLGGLPHSAEVRALMVQHAEAVAAAARGGAPVESGDYQRSIHVEVVDHPSRVVAHVVADVPYAMVVEAATGNLARSLR